MNQLNSIILEGNLVRKPDAKITGKGTPVCNFTVASNRYYRTEGADESKEEVSFFDVETWARQAEVCEKHLDRGRGVRVVGRLKQDRWTDKEGKNQSRIKIVAEHIEFRPRAGNKKEEETDESAVSSTISVPEQSGETKKASTAKNGKGEKSKEAVPAF